MGSANTPLSEDQLLCSICLCVFSEPVSTPCGHNYCKDCITAHWNCNGRYQCPLCKETFDRRPDLRVNTAFKEVVEQFKRIQAETGDVCTAKPDEVPCDICAGPKRKATRSCLVCLASYCATHLEPHQRVPALRRHKLIEPVSNPEDRLCLTHHKPLELFCKTDLVCVCVSCLTDGHAGHKTLSLEEECEARKAQLCEIKADMKQSLKAKSKKVAEIRRSLKQSQEVAQGEVGDCVAILAALLTSVERCGAELVDALEVKQKAVEAQAQSFIDALQQETTELKNWTAKLEQLVRTDDHLRLLQMPPSRCTPPQYGDWSEVGVHMCLCEGTVRRVLAPLEATFLSVMEGIIREVKQFSEEQRGEQTEKATEDEPSDTEEVETRESPPDDGLKSIQQSCAVDVTLDPETASPFVTLSEDRKGMLYNRYSSHYLPYLPYLPTINPKRFLTAPIVLGKQGFSGGSFYYEVNVKGRSWWTVGVAKESVNRKEITSMTPENGYWTIGLYDRWYEANENRNPVRLALDQEPEKVGVFVNYEQNMVSFYDVEARSLMYSFTNCGFCQNFFYSMVYFFTGNLSKLRPKLFPFFNNGFDGKPLIITPVNHTS